MISADEIIMPLIEARVSERVGCNAAASPVVWTWEPNLLSDDVSWGMDVGGGVASCAVVGAGGVIPLTPAAGLNADTCSVPAAVIEVE